MRRPSNTLILHVSIAVVILALLVPMLLRGLGGFNSASSALSAATSRASKMSTSVAGIKSLEETQRGHAIIIGTGLAGLSAASTLL